MIARGPGGATAATVLLTGFVLGTARLVAELNRESLGGWLRAYAEINFLHFAVLLFVVCSAVLVGVSLVTPAPPAHKVDGLTFGGVAAPAVDVENPRWRRTDLILTGVLVLCVLLTWIYFSH